MKLGAALFTLLALSGQLASAEAFTLPAPERVVLENGTVLLLHQKTDVPMVGMQAVLRGGAVADPAGKEGLAALYAALIEKGAGERDSAGFSEAIAAVGGRLSARAGLEGLSISGSFLARDADLMVELLADMLIRPRLDRNEFEKLKSRSINLILAAKDGDPGDLVPAYAAAWLFGEHPYGNTVSGSETTLAAIGHRDMQRYLESAAGGDRLIVSVSGYFDPSEMREKLALALGDWRAASASLPDIPVPENAPGNRVLLVDKPGATQSYFWIGNIGVARDYAQRAELDIANTVFGGRFTSMLNTALRIESGLTYGARAVLVRPSQPGSVGISSYTRTDATVEAIDMALDVQDTLRMTGIPEDAILSAQNYILGQFPTGLETATQLAGEYVTLEFYGLGKEWIDDYVQAIRAVTPESIAAVIDEVYPGRDDLVFVLLGDAEQVRDAVTRYGSVTEMSITEPQFRPPE